MGKYIYLGKGGCSYLKKLNDVFEKYVLIFFYLKKICFYLKQKSPSF